MTNRDRGREKEIRKVLLPDCWGVQKSYLRSALEMNRVLKESDVHVDFCEGDFVRLTYLHW